MTVEQEGTPDRNIESYINLINKIYERPKWSSIPSKHVDLPENAQTSQLFIDAVDRALATLPPREQQTLHLRFGLTDGNIHSRKETGQVVPRASGTGTSLSEERIRQIEAKAKRKLRHPNRAKEFMQFLVQV